jgi:hypothetical protein
MNTINIQRGLEVRRALLEIVREAAANGWPIPPDTSGSCGYGTS